MKYAVEMGSDAMIYIPSFIKIGAVIQTLIGDSQTHIHTDMQTWRSHKPTLGKYGKTYFQFILKVCVTIRNVYLN
jgi:hypothetical protein